MKHLHLSVILMSTLLMFNTYAIDDEGYALSTAIWEDHDISVCWEDLSDSTTVQRQWIKNAVTRTWAEVSDVSFLGWNQCGTSSQGIRIQIQDSGPHVKALGKGLDGMENGMVLNFTYANWSPACQSQVQFCSETIAIHEFGHALGFAHEQNRPDTPATCTDAPQGTNGDTLVGAWDLDSVMNYCNPDWNGSGDLSDTDIAMVVQFYGYPDQWTSLPGQACTTENRNQDQYLTTVESAVRTSATTWVVCPLTNLKGNYGGTSNKMKFYVDMYLAGSSHSVPCYISNNSYYTSTGTWQYIGSKTGSGYKELYKTNVQPYSWGALAVSCKLRAGDRMEGISYSK